jgi:hypothetical protein
LATSQVSQNGFRTKHMDLRLHFVRDLILSKLIRLQYVSTNDNIADFLTKPVGRSKINRALTKFTADSTSYPALHSDDQSKAACEISNSANEAFPSAGSTADSTPCKCDGSLRVKNTTRLVTNNYPPLYHPYR